MKYYFDIPNTILFERIATSIKYLGVITSTSLLKGLLAAFIIALAS